MTANYADEIEQAYRKALLESNPLEYKTLFGDDLTESFVIHRQVHRFAAGGLAVTASSKSAKRIHEEMTSMLISGGAYNYDIGKILKNFDMHTRTLQNRNQFQEVFFGRTARSAADPIAISMQGLTGRLVNFLREKDGEWLKNLRNKKDADSKQAVKFFDGKIQELNLIESIYRANRDRAAKKLREANNIADFAAREQAIISARLFISRVDSSYNAMLRNSGQDILDVMMQQPRKTKGPDTSRADLKKYTDIMEEELAVIKKN